MKTITKITLTGGPCAGKSTAQSWIQNEFTKRGYAVLFVSETATELITGGASIPNMDSPDNFQRALLSMQIAKEKVFELAAEHMKRDKVLIVCDRGLLDNRAYMSEEAFNQALAENHLDLVHARDRYDGVFHLTTAADGAAEAYTTSNNKARTETPEQAIALDHALLNAWAGHPHLRVIGNETNFEAKMQHTIDEIAALLGEPKPYEIERKFLIQYPDLDLLAKVPGCHKVEIIQTYLKSEDPEAEVRVRQRGENGIYIFFRTEKKKIDAATRVEIEHRLSEAEYLLSLMNADTALHTIRKDRYCLIENEHYFEIDIYPFWKDKAIMEIELAAENETFDFPKEVSVIREVTNDDRYRNHSLARNYGDVEQDG